MSETEIALAQAYLSASGQDAVAALIRSVKDLARTRRMLACQIWRDIDGSETTPARPGSRERAGDLRLMTHA